MAKERFTARIRWQADVDPTWELETAHPGFETAEDAALFANGFLEAGADTLRLESGRLYLTLTDHSSAELPVDAVQIWRLPDDGAECQVADDRDFERVPLSIERLSAMGFDGGFTQIKYGVTDTMGAQVNVLRFPDESSAVPGALFADLELASGGAFGHPGETISETVKAPLKEDIAIQAR